MWYSTFDDVFFISIITILTASIAVAFKYCLKSKCIEFKCCWGGIVINRDVNAENNDIENNNIEHNNENNI